MIRIVLYYDCETVFDESGRVNGQNAATFNSENSEKKRLWKIIVFSIAVCILSAILLVEIYKKHLFLIYYYGKFMIVMTWFNELDPVSDRKRYLKYSFVLPGEKNISYNYFYWNLWIHQVLFKKYILHCFKTFSLH